MNRSRLLDSISFSLLSKQYFRQFLTIVAVLLLVSACATPDIKPFANQTAVLAGAVEGELTAIESKFTQIEEWAETKEDANKWIEQRKRYVVQKLVVSAVLSDTVKYSTALVELAEAGETGSAAVDSIVKTMNGFASVVGIAGMPANFATSVAGKALKEIATAVTRVQAQNKLRDVILTTSGTDGAITLMAALIEDIYADVQLNFIAALNREERRLIQNRIGVNALQFYRSISDDRELENYYANLRLLLPDKSQNPSAKRFCEISKTEKMVGGKKVVEVKNTSCILGVEIQSMAALHQVLAVLQPKEIQYKDLNSKAAKWQKARTGKAAAIVAAVKVWVVEHQKLADVLEQCGGLRALNSKCGNLTAANLKAAVEKIKAIYKEN